MLVLIQRFRFTNVLRYARCINCRFIASISLGTCLLVCVLRTLTCPTSHLRNLNNCPSDPACSSAPSADLQQCQGRRERQSDIKPPPQTSYLIVAETITATLQNRYRRNRPGKCVTVGRSLAIALIVIGSPESHNGGPSYRLVRYATTPLLLDCLEFFLQLPFEGLSVERQRKYAAAKIIRPSR